MYTMKETLKNLKSVYRFGKKYKKNFLFFTIATCFGVLFNIIVPILTAQQIVYLTNNQFYQLILSTLLIFAILFLNTIKLVVIQKNTAKYFRGVSKNIQNQLGSEMLKIEQKEIDNSSSGALIKRLTDDVSQMSHVFTIGEGYLTAILSKIGIFITIFIINKIIFLYYVCCSAILIWIDLNGLKKYTKKNIEYKECEDEVSSLTGELVRGIKDIKMLNSEKSFMQIFNQKIDGMSNKLYQVRDITIHYDAIINTLNDFFVIGLIFLLIFLIQNNHMETAIAVVLFTYRSEVLENIIDSISNLLTLVKNFNLSCSRVFEIIDNQKYEKEKFGNQHINKINGNFEFKNVSFKYPGSDNYAVNDVNMKFEIGKRLAVVGMNGSGKTTFIKLLCRLYDPTEGEILLNGIDIRKYNYREYMDIFAVVFQDFKLLSLKLGENVASNIVYDKDKVVDCLNKAGFAERLAYLPDGLETYLYKDYQQSGIEVSGGEAQKIAIARALYKDAPFIILDEPTAALDPLAEEEIYNKFNDIAGDKTAVYISHRLSSCKFCDEIVVFHEGKVIQQGNHDQLLADESGKYHELWHAQAQYYAKKTKVSIS